jgi:hypothetical protein
MRLAFVVLAVACGSPAKPTAPPTPAAPANECARVADHLLSLMTDTAKDAPTEQLDRVRVAFERHCKDDHWSTAAQRCFLDLETKADVDRCATQLTDTQRQALEQPPEAAK